MSKMVMDYTCLFWATMKTGGDRCYNSTTAPRKPCRSFCTEVSGSGRGGVEVKLCNVLYQRWCKNW